MKPINQKLIKNRIIPEHEEAVYFEELSAVVYINKKNNLSAKAFSGRRKKSDFYYRFDSIQSMEKSIESWKKRLQSYKNAQEESAKKSREYQHDFNVGDILYTSWGYDETRVDFFEVIEIVSNKSIKICEISKTVCDINYMNVKPCKNKFIGEPVVKKVSVNGTVTMDGITAFKLKYDSMYCTPSFMSR